jgi:hypothetical protein
MEAHHAILNNPKFSPAQLREWSVRPWMAYPFLAATLSPSPGMNALGSWYASAAGNPATGDIFARQWAIQFPDDAKELETRVATLSGGIGTTLNVQGTTNEHQRELREKTGINWLEDSFWKTKEFLWDDFSEHPATAIAAVVSLVFAYRFISKRPTLFSMVGLAAGGTVLYTLAKDKFNFQPGEWAAGLGEMVGGKPTGDFIRKLRDTIRAPFLGAEAKGSALAYFEREIGLNDEGEKIIFPALIRQNPAAMLAWYDQARVWELSGPPAGISLPGSLESDLQQQNMPSWFRELPQERKAMLVLQAMKKTFGHIGRNDKGIDPLAFVRSRFIDGSYYDEAYGEWHNGLESSQPGDLLYKARHTDPTARSIAQRMKQLTRSGSGQMDVLDLLLMTEGNPEKIAQFFPGFTVAEVVKFFADAGKKVATIANDFVIKPTVKFATETVPNFVVNDVPKIIDAISKTLEKNGITVENASLLLKQALDSAIAAGKTVVTFAEGTPMWRILRDAGVLTFNDATKLWEMSIHAAEQLAVWLDWQRFEQQYMAADFPNWKNQIFDTANKILKAEAHPAGLDIAAGSKLFELRNPQHREVWNLLKSTGVITTYVEHDVGGKTYIQIEPPSTTRLEERLKILLPILEPRKAPQPPAPPQVPPPPVAPGAPPAVPPAPPPAAPPAGGGGGPPP